MLHTEWEIDIYDDNMPRRATSPLSQKDVLSELRAKRAYHAEQVANIDNILAAIDQTLGTTEPLLLRGDAAQPPPASQNLPIPAGLSVGCFRGYSLADAAIAAIPKIGSKAQPPSTGQIWAALVSTGYRNASARADAVLNGTLRKREGIDGEVLLLGRGLWGIRSWYSDQEAEHIIATRGGKPGRNPAKHGALTRNGMRAALERGVHIGRPLKRLTPEALALAKQMLFTGHTVNEVASAVHASTQSIYNYFSIKRDEEGRVIEVTPK
jgi:hypothetical protein